MITALRSFNNEELQSIGKRVSVVRIENKKNADFTLTKKTVKTISDDYTALHNSFNKIFANLKNIKALQEAQSKSEITQNAFVPVSGKVIGTSEFTASIGVLGKIFEHLAKQLDKLDLTSDQQQIQEDGQEEIDIDIKKKKKPKTKRTRSRGGRGKAKSRGGRFGAFGKALDITGDALENSFNVVGKSLGIASDAIQTTFNVVGKSFGIVGEGLGVVGKGLKLTGGALATLGGGYLLSKAYDRAKPSQADKNLVSATSNVAATPVRREPTPIGNNSYSSRFADYLKKTIMSIAVSSPFVGAAMSIVSSIVNQPDLSGKTDQNFQSVMDTAASLGDPHPELTAAQWALESGYGTSRMARELNNPFGQTTNNPSDGETVAGKDGVTRIFKRYNSTEDAIKHHVDRWNKKYTTKDQTPEQALSAIINNNYVGNPNSGEAQQYYRSIASILAKNNIKYGEKYTYVPPPPTGMIDQRYFPNGGSGNFVNPVPGAPVTSEFGMRTHPILKTRKFHSGMDFHASQGTPVLAAHDGKIVRAEFFSSYGNTIDILGSNGLLTRYAHLSKINVTNGASVSAGQPIGNVGSTGRSTGPHLHFEVRINDNPVNPVSFINGSNKQPMVPLSPMRNNMPTPPRRRRGDGSLLMINGQANPFASYQPYFTPKSAPSSGPRSANPNSANLFMAYHGY